ncbi:MAG: hypothetical protein ACM3ZQ_10805 [Bacillota bacterium]
MRFRSGRKIMAIVVAAMVIAMILMLLAPAIRADTVTLAKATDSLSSWI